uniref:Uncharacterized protein n=1 Tax=Leptospirillum sp. Group II '5-way CG' TaxID=419541 RepID=B6ANK0_9BACT|nr:MAG: Hypothetical protein CGL2_11276210a [Leptospirillum sp. Group II '5-way CG']
MRCWQAAGGDTLRRRKNDSGVLFFSPMPGTRVADEGDKPGRRRGEGARRKGPRRKGPRRKGPRRKGPRRKGPTQSNITTTPDAPVGGLSYFCLKSGRSVLNRSQTGAYMSESGAK